MVDLKFPLNLVSDVGCAMIKYIRDDFYNVLFTCNYGANTHVDYRVYEAGTPCSKCLTGCNRIYHHLCSADEQVSPNIKNPSFKDDADDVDDDTVVDDDYRP